MAKATHTLYDLLLKLGVNEETLSVADDDALIRNHLLCSFEIDYDPEVFHPKILEDAGWGDSNEVTEIIGVQLGNWGRGRGGKMDLGLSFGVYEIMPLETRVAKGAFGRPAQGPDRLIKPRPAKERAQRVVRVIVTDSAGDHILEQPLDVECTEVDTRGRIVVSHMPRWDVCPGPLVMDVCGTYQSWISVIFTGGDGSQFHAAWSRKSISKEWWTAYDWATRNLSHYGCDHVYWTGMDDLSWMTYGT